MITTTNNVQYGVPLANGKADRRAVSGRTCSDASCDTVLSTYNKATTCWLHTSATTHHALAPTNQRSSR
jgi:hypothetical protein